MSAGQFLSEYGVLIDKLVTLPLEAPITDAIQVLEAQGISSVPVTRSEV
jgi:CBS domain-containing protein